MNIILLIFFAIPLAVIIFSLALQKLLKCPALVAGIIFAIGIIITFIVGNIIVLAATLVYTFISYITAVITCLIRRFFCNDDCNHCCRKNRCDCHSRNNGDNDLLTIRSNCSNNGNGDLLTISSNCANGNTNDLLTISSNGECTNGNFDNDCGCCNNRSNQVNTINGTIRIVDNNCSNQTDEITTRINVVPNTANNGRSGCICGRYRRR